MSDLTERLRASLAVGYVVTEDGRPLAKAAADRIEELEDALREIQDGDRFGYHAKHFAAAALGGDGDE